MTIERTVRGLLLGSTALARLALALTGVAAMAGTARATDDLALPTGGSVAGGSAAIVYGEPGRLDVRQHSNRAVIDWESFDIGRDAMTEFHQPDASSIAVNRIHDRDPSRIFGQLKANGQLMLLNRNGFLFGPSARIDVAGLVASTGTIDADAFMAGSARIAIGGADRGEIVNEGQITVAEAGIAAFVAPTVRNAGVIRARLGRVDLAAGSTATLDLYGDRLIEIALDDGAEAALVEHSGRIEADGGQVTITAKAAAGLVESVINLMGVVQADSIAEANGAIVLGADVVSLAEGSTLRADGGAGAADAGRIEVAAAGRLEAAGTLTARGGSGGGDGGVVETSGARVAIADTVRVDTRAPEGETGTWLIDPVDLTVVAGSDGAIGDEGASMIGAATVVAALESSNVRLEAENSITVAAEIDSSGQTNAHTLSLADQNADGELTVNLDAAINLGANQTLTGDATTVKVGNAGSIQNGVDVAAANATIDAAAGTYHPESTIDIDKPLTLRGAQFGVDARSNAEGARTPGGAGESIIDGDGSLATLIEISAADVVIDGFELRNGTGDLVHSEAAEAANPTIRNTIIHGSSGDEGIQLKNTTDALIERNRVFDTLGDGINLAGSDGGRILSNEVHDIASPDAAIYVYTSTDTTIEGNLVYDVTRNDGIKLGDSEEGDDVLTGGAIRNNTVHDVVEDGIVVYTSRTEISGNEVYRSNGTNGAIFVDEDVDDVRVLNNDVHDNGAAGDGKTTFGIRVGKDGEPTNVVVAGNVLADNEEQLFHKAGGSAIEDLLAANTFDRAVTVTGGNAVWSTIGGAVGAAAAGDIVTVGNGTYGGGITVDKDGIAIVGTAGATVTSTGVTDVFTIAADNVTIRDLTIQGPYAGQDYAELDWASEPQSRGVHVRRGAQNFTVAGNTVRDIRTGIYVDGATGGPDGALGSIAGNTFDNTKGAILVNGDGAGLAIDGNASGAIGNEWGIVLNLNIGPLQDEASAARQQELLELDARNNGMAVLDRLYRESNRTRVVAKAGSVPGDDFGLDNGLGNPRQPLASLNDAIKAVVAGGTIDVEAGDYVEGVEGVDYFGGAGGQRFGLYVYKDGLTIRGVDASGEAIADADEALATIIAAYQAGFGAQHFVSGSGVTIQGLTLKPAAGGGNKTLEVIGDDFALRDSVIDNTGNATGTALYISDFGLDGRPDVESFRIEGNRFVAGSGPGRALVVVANGAGDDTDAANRIFAGNEFVGNGSDGGRGIQIQGRIPWIGWLPNEPGAVTIEENTFGGFDLPVRSVGELTEGLDWTGIFANNAFASGAVLTFAADGSVRESTFTDGTDEVPDIYISREIQDSVIRAKAGDEVRVKDGAYALDSTLEIDKSLSLVGESESGVVINAPAGGYGIFVTADDVSLSKFTLDGPSEDASGSYGIKVNSADIETGDWLTGFSLSEVTVRGSGRSEIDLNGVDGAAIENVTADGQGTKGVGIGVTDSRNVILTGVTTRGNAWSGVGLYTGGRYGIAAGVDSIAIDGTSRFAEANKVYTERGERGGTFTNLSLAGFDHQVRNAAHRENGADFTYYQRALADALDFATTYEGFDEDFTRSTVKSIADETYHVAERNGVTLSIQAAVDDAAGGETIAVGAGSHALGGTPLTIGKAVRLAFDNAGVSGTIDASANLAMTGSMTLLGDLSILSNGADVDLLATLTAARSGPNLVIDTRSGAARGSVRVGSAGTATNPLASYTAYADDFEILGTYHAGAATIDATGDVFLGNASLNTTADAIVKAGGDVGGKVVSKGGSVGITAGGDVNTTAEGGTVSIVSTGGNVTAAARGGSIAISAPTGDVIADTTAEVVAVSAGGDVALTTASGRTSVFAGGTAAISGTTEDLTVQAPRQILTGDHHVDGVNGADLASVNVQQLGASDDVFEGGSDGGDARPLGRDASADDDADTGSGVVVADFDQVLSPLLEGHRVVLDLSILPGAGDEEEGDSPVN